jgi:hypothetical protein
MLVQLDPAADLGSVTCTGTSGLAPKVAAPMRMDASPERSGLSHKLMEFDPRAPDSCP